MSDRLIYSGGYETSIAKGKELLTTANNTLSKSKEAFTQINALQGKGDKLNFLTGQASDTVLNTVTKVVGVIEQINKVLVEADDAYVSINEGGR